MTKRLILNLHDAKFVTGLLAGAIFSRYRRRRRAQSIIHPQLLAVESGLAGQAWRSRTVMVADLRLVAQADRPNAGRDIEAGVPLDAERLQRNRSIGAANQDIGTGADADRRASGGAEVIPRQSTRRETGARREHTPN